MSLLKCLTSIALLTLGTTIPNVAQGTVVFPSDITAFGTYAFDEGGSFVSDGVTSTGTLFSRVGGTAGETLTYSGGNTTSGRNPVGSLFSNHGGGVVGGGDGFGGTAFLAASTSAGDAFFRADTDLDNSNPNSSPLVLSNLSPDTQYKILLSLTYDHTVDAFGSDAGIRSDIDLELNGNRIFNSQLISDTVFGNVVDSSMVDSFGGELTDGGVFQFEVILDPLDFALIGFDYTLESPDAGFEDGSVTGVSSYFLSIDSVTAVPEPGSMTLMSSVLVSWLVIRRRRHAVAAAPNEEQDGTPCSGSRTSRS